MWSTLKDDPIASGGNSRGQSVAYTLIIGTAITQFYTLSSSSGVFSSGVLILICLQYC